MAGVERASLVPSGYRTPVMLRQDLGCSAGYIAGYTLCRGIVSHLQGVCLTVVRCCRQHCDEYFESTFLLSFAASQVSAMTTL